jgi:hypothetical protein
VKDPQAPKPYTLIGSGYSTGWAAAPGGWFHFGGALDDLRVYGRALSSSEVTTLATLPSTSAGPVAWWKFDESSGTLAGDATDHGKDGTVTGATWLPTGGMIGGALQLDGTTTRVDLPNSLIESPAYETLTLATWMRTTSTNGGVIFAYQNGPYPTAIAGQSWYQPVLYLTPQDGILHAGVWGSSSNSRPLQSSARVNDGVWHHVAIVVGTTNETLYVDGVAVDVVTGTKPWGPFLPSGWLYNQIGTGYGKPGSGLTGWTFYSGLLDDMRLYGRALSAAEVAQIKALH